MQFEEKHPDASSQLLERFFTGLSEYTFYSQLGCTDTELVCYVSDLLVRFTKSESLNRIGQWNGLRAPQVVALLTQSQTESGVDRRELHRHIGDFTLFWTGLYPESLQRLKRDHSDCFLEFCLEGKRAYGIASEISKGTDEERPPTNDLLHRLSQQFDLCAEGLREIRRQWEGPSDGSKALLV